MELMLLLRHFHFGFDLSKHRYPLTLTQLTVNVTLGLYRATFFPLVFKDVRDEAAIIAP